MSEHPSDPPPGPGADGPRPDPRHDDPCLDDVPPVAGGTDDSPPAQGEGESDSW